MILDLGMSLIKLLKYVIIILEYCAVMSNLGLQKYLTVTRVVVSTAAFHARARG